MWHRACGQLVWCAAIDSERSFLHEHLAFERVQQLVTICVQDESGYAVFIYPGIGKEPCDKRQVRPGVASSFMGIDRDDRTIIVNLAYAAQVHTESQPLVIKPHYRLADDILKATGNQLLRLAG